LLEGALPPGSRLKDEELAEWFGAGHCTVRSALRTIAAAGLLLLEHQLNRGARVPYLLPARVDELHAYRTVLQVGALRLAQPKSKPQGRVEQATAALVELRDDTSWPEAIGVHQEIHRAITRWKPQQSPRTAHQSARPIAAWW
jgi:DNA-binding GntR family transcriptional regulator